MYFSFLTRAVTAISFVLLLTDCGGGGGNSGGTAVTTGYTVSGTVTGLKSDQQVTLLTNDADPVTLSANGSFVVPTKVSGSYAVTVGTQPASQTCAVSSNGANSSITGDVNNVIVSCYQFTQIYSSAIYANLPVDVTVGSIFVRGSDGNFYFASYGTGVTVYRITPPGVVTQLYTFNLGVVNGGVNSFFQGSDGNFYGTTGLAGANNAGTVFKVTPGGPGTILYSFPTGTALPSVFFESGGYVYGSTGIGGTVGCESLFKLSVSGSESTWFASQSPQQCIANLFQGNDGNFYGTTANSLFEMSLSGTFTAIANFSTTYPLITLRGNDGNFYGTTYTGGAFGDGSAIKITPSGVETLLYSFNDQLCLPLMSGESTCTGVFPVLYIQAGDGNFYGTTSIGGTNSTGTLIKMTPDGIVTQLHDFGANHEISGNKATSLVVGNDGNIYGTDSMGNVFSIAI